jgi:hypothetical protein
LSKKIVILRNRTLTPKITPGQAPRMAGQFGLEQGDCPVTDITSAANHADHLEKPLSGAAKTDAYINPDQARGHDSRRRGSDASMAFNAPIICAKVILLPHSSIFFARIIGLLKINTSSN